MNDEDKVKPKRTAILIVVVVALVAIALAVLQFFITARNTGSCDACLQNIRHIEKIKETGQPAPQSTQSKQILEQKERVSTTN